MTRGGDITVCVSNVRDLANNLIGSPVCGTHTAGSVGTPPTSSCEITTTLAFAPLTDIAWTASDGTGWGVGAVELWYKSGSDGTWTYSGKSGTGPSGIFDSWTPPNGDGIYYIRTLATDLDGNVETDLPAGGDDSVVYYTTPPQIISAVSSRTHGGTNSFEVDVLDISARECRAGGPTSLVVTFTTPIQQVGGSNADVQLSSGEVVGLSVGGVDNTQLTIQLSGVTNGQLLLVGFAGISRAGCPPCVVPGALCFGVLLGDVAGDGLVNVLDLVSIRNNLQMPVDAGRFRADVNMDGTINIFDLTVVRNNLNQAIGN